MALSIHDIDCLMRLEAVYASNLGKLLALSKENEIILVEPTDTGFIPQEAMFSAPHKVPLHIWGVSVRRIIKEALKVVNVFAKFVKIKLSQELCDYLWPSDEDLIQVQFRSPVAGLPPCGELKSSLIDVEGGEYCLAACDDGTLKWLHESECGNGNHVWTVYLFDRYCREMVNLRDKLQRRGSSNAHNNYVTNTYIGRNSNESGKQKIGTSKVTVFNGTISREK